MTRPKRMTRAEYDRIKAEWEADELSGKGHTDICGYHIPAGIFKGPGVNSESMKYYLEDLAAEPTDGRVH